MPFNSKTAKESGIKSSRKGVKNKLSTEIKEKLLNVLVDNIDDFKVDFKALKPKERIEMTMKLLDYAIPKIKGIQKGEKEEVSQEEKLIEAMEWQKERQKVLLKKIEEANEAKSKREGLNTLKFFKYFI